jgi:hypothetical protein
MACTHDVLRIRPEFSKKNTLRRDFRVGDNRGTAIFVDPDFFSAYLLYYVPS